MARRTITRWLAALAVAAVSALPLVAAADSPPGNGASSSFCDGSLSGVISDIKSGPIQIAAVGGKTQCWSYLGELSSDGSVFTLSANLPVYQPYLEQVFTHTATAYMNVVVAPVSYIGIQVAWSLQVKSSIGGLLYSGGCDPNQQGCNGPITVHVPLGSMQGQSSDDITINGSNVAVLSVSVGDSSVATATPTAAPSATATPVGTATPGPSPTAAPVAAAACGLIQDCTFSTVPGNGGALAAGSPWSANCYPLDSYAIRHTYATTQTLELGQCRRLLQSVGQPPAGVTSLYLSVWLKADTTWWTNVDTFHFGSWPAFLGEACGTDGLTQRSVEVPSSALSGQWQQFTAVIPWECGDTTNGGVLALAPDNGSNGDIEVMSPTASWGGVPAVTPVPTLPPTFTPTAPVPNTPIPVGPTAPAGTVGPGGLINTPVPFQPTPVVSGTTPGVAGHAGVCTQLQFPTSQPLGADSTPGWLANIPIVGGIASSVSDLIHGLWSLLTGLFVPQHISCDVEPLIGAVQDRLQVPAVDLSTFQSAAAATSCGTLGISGLSVPWGGAVNATIDSCAQPWATVIPLGRVVMQFGLIGWFVMWLWRFVYGLFGGGGGE